MGIISFTLVGKILYVSICLLLLVIEFPRLVFASAKFAARARAGCVINTRQGEIYPHSDPDYSY